MQFLSNATRIRSILSISFQFGEVPNGKIGAGRGKREKIDEVNAVTLSLELRSPTSAEI